MKFLNLKFVALVMLLCSVFTNDVLANGCSGSQFTLTYSPFCGCWQLCGGYGNALLISDCDDLTDLSINWGDGSPPYQFSFGGTLPCHDYAPGTYTAVLRIEGYCHSIFGTQTCNIAQTITVSPTPFDFEANFVADTVCNGEITSFNSTSIIAPGVLNVNWEYYFGDGDFSIGNPNPVHYYDSCGAYDVMLVLTGQTLCCDNTGRDTIIKRIYVNCPPNTNSNPLGLTDPYIYESWSDVDMNEVCLGDPTNFNLNQHDSITFWNFTFADGGSSQLLNPTHTYAFCPPFITWVRVELENTRGCRNVLEDTAVVHCPVFANFAGTTGTLCAGDCNGTATINITGGTPSYTIQWNTNPPQNTLTAINLCPGAYDVTVTDNFGCSDTQTLNVFSPDLFTGTVSATDIACNGWLTGTAVVNVQGGTPPNTFYWSPGGGTGQTNSGLGPGTYNVTATDANGCTFTASGTIGEPPVITATFTHTDANCLACDGSATVFPSGGTPPYTFFWPATGQTTATATGLCSGIYFVEVTDSTPGCTRVFSVAIGNLGADPGGISSTNVTCANSCDGSATITMTPACPSCTYDWLQNGTPIGQTTNVASGLCAGDYVGRVTNPVSGCQSVFNATITVPNPMTLTPSATGITCNGLCDGQVTVTAAGGTSGYSYQWRDASNNLVGSTQTVGSLCPGTYTVQVTDQAGCMETATATVATYVFTGIATPTAISCFGDCNAQILATPQIGTPPYSFLWDNAGVPIGTNSPILANLCAGTYNVTITDFTNCAITLPPIVIGQPTQITASTSSTPALCHGDCDGSATVVGSGGTPAYTYQWADAQIAPIHLATSDVLNNLCAGLYHVQVRDANNCSSPWTPVTVTQPDSLVLIIAVTQPHCGNGGLASMNLTVTGGTAGYTYLWSTGETTEDITGITTTGNYCVSVTDGNACTASACADIIQPAVMNSFISSPTRNGFNVDCFGDTTGSIFLNVTGGLQPYTYVWSDNTLPDNDTLLYLTAGTYDVTVYDATGCSITNTITLIQPPPLLLARTDVANLCAGDSSASISITLSGGVPVSPQIPYAIHWVYLTDTSVHISDTSAALTGLVAGQYYVFAFDTMACIIRDTIDIIDPLPVQASLSIVNGACAGGGTGSIDLTPVGGTPGYSVQWTWSTGTSTDEDLSGLAPDSYFVTITDANSCQVIDTAVVIEPTPLAATITATPTSCFGGSDGTIDVTPSGGSPAYGFSWNLVPDTTEDLNGIASGNYLVTVIDQGGCTVTTGIFVDQPAPIFGTGSLQVCNGDSAFLGGVWRNTNGTYPDTATTVAGCDSFLQVTLSLVDSFLINVDHTICFGDSFLINGTFHSTSGTYRNPLIASGGCDSIVMTALTILPDLDIRTDPSGTDTIFIGESVTINVLNNPGVTISDYLWTPIEGLSCTDCPSTVATPDASISYSVLASVVHDSLVCYDSASVNIVIDSVGHIAIYIPNAFTPNGDGINDYFMIYGRGFTSFKLFVFDRWGTKLFESYDQNVGWDGTFRDKQLNPGVYVYYTEIEFIDGSRPSPYIEYWKGSVTLIR